MIYAINCKKMESFSYRLTADVHERREEENRELEEERRDEQNRSGS